MLRTMFYVSLADRKLSVEKEFWKQVRTKVIPSLLICLGTSDKPLKIGKKKKRI